MLTFINLLYFVHVHAMACNLVAVDGGALLTAPAVTCHGIDERML